MSIPKSSGVYNRRVATTAATASITLGEVARLLALPVWLSDWPEVVGSAAGALDEAGAEGAAAEEEGELAAALLRAAAMS